ncbi:MAG: family 10 glycosylhydrolase, partial [Thermoanaerobaculia bacterium]
FWFLVSGFWFLVSGFWFLPYASPVKRLLVPALALFLAACATTHPLPHRARELRGLWVTTVNNGDWPSRRDLTPEAQRQELIAILDRAASLHLNAIFLQVRPKADAVYASSLEPWSEFLSGTMGKPPEPFYDPLSFAITEAHARGMELHAWFNPFRAHHPNPESPQSAAQVVRLHPEQVVDYGKYVWLDPGDPAVRTEVLNVIADVVKRYDVDGVHLDDYFYPYQEKDAAGQVIDFPDEPTWQRYQSGGGRLSRNDWRRDSINQFVRDLYRSVKGIRNRVEVGISPFGIWRPHHPPQIEGLDSYEKIYADSRLWLQNGWVDYLAPQLYWPIAKREQSFPVLLRWWSEQDVRGRGIVAGMSINRVSTGRPASVTPEEIAQQLALVKSERRAVGFILFSARTLMENRGGINEVIGPIVGQ